MEFDLKDSTPLNKEDFEAAAKTLGCKVEDIEAVFSVEGGRDPHALLFESHAFHTHTDGVYDSVYPDLSTPTWVRNYGAAGQHQWDRLNKAIILNREAALKSAS